MKNCEDAACETPILANSEVKTMVLLRERGDAVRKFASVLHSFTRQKNTRTETRTVGEAML